ncbi:hypothetical protein Q1695_005603 [Nippostrongylus brasiliensis]|nr:hypothetical protein Q1695_005603 [Nippostrongylus brasiliensis]
MVRQTRAASRAESDESIDQVEVDAPRKGPPQSDVNFERKFVVAKENSLPNSKLYLVRHPKNRTPCIYRIDEKHCDEVVSIGDTYRSWFYGESVVSDGLIRLFSPIHPLFLALPYFISSKTKFVELEELVCDSECPSIAALLQNEQFLRNISKISDCKEICDTTVYRFNESKALEWISDRFQRLRQALVEEGGLHKSILENVDVLDRYAYGMLCDYLNSEMAALVKSHLSIQDPPTDENGHVDMSMKRKAEDMYEDVDQKPVKKPKESITKKKLQQASKGTKAISNFFTTKKA